MANTVEDVHSIARYLVTKPSLYQKALHWGSNQVSYYGHHIKAIAFSVRVWDALPSSPNNQYTSFKVNSKYHLMRGAYIEFTTPAMQVKDQFKDKIKIGLPRKMAHYVFEDIIMKFNGDPGPSLNSHSLNVNEQYYITDNSHQQRYLREIGDISELTNMSTHIPSYRYSLWLPFFFSMDPALSLPLHRCTLTKITFDVKFKKDICEVLRYEEIEHDKTGKRVANVTVDIEKISGLSNPNSRIILPIMRGLYSKITPEERTEISQSSPDYMDVPCYMPINVGGNAVPLGGEKKIALDIHYPARAIFWMGELATNHKRRIFANYTSDQFDHRHGTNPCHSVTLWYNQQAAMRAYPQEHFERIESRFFPSAPRDIGYNALALCENKTIVDVEPGIDLGKHKASLTVNLEERDQYKILDVTTKSYVNLDYEGDEEEEENQEIVHQPIPKSIKKMYYLYAVALVTRRLKFVNTKEGVELQCPQAADITDSDKSQNDLS